MSPAARSPRPARGRASTPRELGRPTRGRRTSALRAPPARSGAHRAFAAALVAAVLAAALLLGTGCKPSYNVGDHVLVEWEGNVYPAMVIATEGPAKYKIHYDGYDTIWDEVVPRERVKGLVEGNVVHPEPPPKVRAKALTAAQTNVHKVGDRVRVEWHGQLYPAVVTAIVGQEKYRVHYEGYGAEWDETVGLSRIQAK